MPAVHISIVDEVPPPLVAGLDQLRTELSVPVEFPPEVTAAAEASVAAGPADDPQRQDFTGVEFVTIDPEGSMDLDQAVFIERLPETGSGYRVWYAIADVAAWVEPGGPIDVEAHQRGQTIYAPNAKASLHPPALSESAASLLDDGLKRPALVWQIAIDDAGETTSASVERGWVVSRGHLTYTGVQKDLDAGTASASLQLLREVGEKLLEQEARRGGVSLNLPEEEVSVHDGTWTIDFRTPLPVEGWNAEISLLTGRAAADIMLNGGVGILRTLPPIDPGALERLRRIAAGLKIDWPTPMGYAEFVRSLDPAQPTHLAMLNSCTALFRGAAYTVIGPDTDPKTVEHAALAANYAHATAPLRRLVDRYVGEICVHLCEGTPVPDWVLAALANLPAEMAESDHRAKKFERGVIDLVEALSLSGLVGEQFAGVVIEVSDQGHRGTISIPEPAVMATVTGKDLPLGASITVTLAKCDIETGQISFTA